MKQKNPASQVHHLGNRVLFTRWHETAEYWAERIRPAGAVSYIYQRKSYKTLLLYAKKISLPILISCS